MQSKSENTHDLLFNIIFVVGLICVIIGASRIIYNNYTNSNNDLDSVVIGNTYEVLDIRDDTYNNISIVLKDTTTESRIYYEYNGKNYGKGKEYYTEIATICKGDTVKYVAENKFDIVNEE